MSLEAWLGQQGVHSEPTEKTRLLNGLLHLLGAVETLEVLDYWRDDSWLRLFRSAALRKGRAYTVPELRQIAQPGADTPAFMEQLAQLVGRGGFRRGFNLECTTCGMRFWYSLAEAAVDPLFCQGCVQPISLPLEQPFAYRPNALLCTALKNGMLTEILVLLWARRTWGTFAHQANVLLRHGSASAEIDLILHMPDQRILLVEAKDAFGPAQPAQTLPEQMRQMGRFAALIDAQMVLATLQPGSLSPDRQRYLVETNTWLLREDDLKREKPDDHPL